MPPIVGCDVPAGANPFQNNHFEALAAATRTLKSDTPVIAVVAHEDKVPGRQRGGKRIAIENPE